MASKKPGGLAALSALRASLPTGPQPACWIVATDNLHADVGWLAITRYRQTIGGGGSNQPDLVLPGVSVQCAIIEGESGCVLEVESFKVTSRAPSGAVIENPTFGPSLRVDGVGVTQVGAKLAIVAASAIEVRGGERSYRLRVVNQQPATAKVVPPPPKPKRRGADLILRRETREVTGDLTIAGWLEIADGGVLRCTGTVRCLGATLEGGAVLSCHALVTNYLHADNSEDGVRIEASAIHARVVARIQLALAELIERGALHADYHQHFGGDLNPSWDSVTGTLRLRPDLFTRDDGAELVELFEDRIRAAACAGEDLFVDCEPLVRA